MDFCPNCGNKEIEKTAENEIYCPECDKTFTVDKGKKIRAQPKNRISQVEQAVKNIGDVVKGIQDQLKPVPKGESDELWPE